ncbi:hypothetical protein BDV96DRAFT_643012 [Lophiotrema nucula]|uniref:feruloyl esterase n=1 Tax=Lophiotrema nucula TaxID=690887 RepID=A0A6A5ZH89_9PLEO|nr:hypothetical protein BDV96DRAFT_643012 [Lophiotrema nucula]
MEEMTRLPDPYINQDYIVAYPQGTNDMWMGNPLAPEATYPDDRPFIINLLDSLEDTLCLGKSRTYITGFSNGGGLSGLLSCYPPALEWVAAFSAVAGAYYMTPTLPYITMFDLGECEGDRGRRGRVPFMEIHGDADMPIAYDGNNTRAEGVSGPSTVPVLEWLERFAARNSRNASLAECAAQEQRYAEPSNVADEDESKGKGSVVKTYWYCGAEKEAVVGYQVTGLGHGWPSTVPLDSGLEGFRLGPTTWNASSVLLEWFTRFSLSRR